VPEKYSRNYQSIPQPGLNGRSSPVYSAAVVGGATVINGMFFNRGSAADYDAWEKLGNPGWGWKDLLPYFQKVSPSIVPGLVRLTPVGFVSERNLHSSARRFGIQIPHLK
jgi:choline dehydrogenase-like flavoprotein